MFDLDLRDKEMGREMQREAPIIYPWVRLLGSSQDPLLRMLGELVSSVSGSATRPSVVRRLAEGLSAHLPIQRLELGWLTAEWGTSERVIALRQEDRWKLTSHPSERLLPLISKALRENAMYVARSREGENHQAHCKLLLPLSEGTTTSGYAELHMSETAEAKQFLEWEGLALVCRLFAMLLDKLTLVERVAHLSQKAHRENKRLRETIEQFTPGTSLVAVSQSMRDVVLQAKQVSRFDTTVLLQGDSGTGKERLARHIHELSSRAKKPFLQINCGALPEGLLESELFGHEKGSFTGANRRHLGCFERAHGGTLLLDEVAELSPAAQVKLLRVLQEGTFSRVGGEEPLQIDVRVLAATHQPLEQLVDMRSFRADLFYRLNVFPIYLPSLRDRKDDIPALVHELLSHLTQRLNCRMPRLQSKDLTLLQSHQWPGNIRELENTLERALILSSDHPDLFSESLSQSIPNTQSHIQTTLRRPPHSWNAPTLKVAKPPAPPQLKANNYNTYNTQPSEPPSSPNTSPIEFNDEYSEATTPNDEELDTFEDAIRRSIEQALVQSNGQIYGESGAAKILNLKPSTLQSKMKKLGIERKAFRA